jgi:YD repeat-containing protein
MSWELQPPEIPYEQTAGNTASRRLIEDLRTTYLNDALTAELPFGTQGNAGLKYQQYQLAFTPGLLQNIFGNKIDPADANPANRPDSLMPQGNFVHFMGDSNWWIPSGTISNITGGETVDDAKARFYAPVLYTDPAGATTTITYYQNYFLLISNVEDELNNTTHVEAFNFYTLQPSLIRDHNDNLSQVLYDELGLLKAVAFLGKDLNQDNVPEAELADDLVGLTDSTSVSETTNIQNFFQTEDSVPLAALSRTLLQHATIRYVYDYDKYLSNGSPIAIATIMRAVHHANETPQNQGQIFTEFEYTNGTGQVVMVKMQGEPGMAKKVTVNNDNTFSVTTVDTSAQIPERLRWVGNGRVVLNNKGKPVKQFEPYFSVTPFYESQPELVETGVTPVIHYDPLGRIIGTDLPEGTFTKLEFTSWYRMVYDVNDNTLQSKWYNDRFNHLIDAELLAEGKDPAKGKRSGY